MDIDDYDPYQHRTAAELETWVALIHYIKGHLGTGILAMPLAFQSAGCMGGPVILLLASIMVAYGLQLLIRCKYKLCKKKLVPFLSFGEAFRYALEIGPPTLCKYSAVGYVFIEVMVWVTQFGACVSYCMFIPSNIKSLVDSYTDPSTHLNLRAYIVIMTIPFLLIIYVKNYRHLAPFSIVSNICSLVGIIIVFVYIFKDGLGDISDRDILGEPLHVLPFFGTCLFSLVSVGVVLSLEQHMKYPRDWIKPFGVQNIGMTILFFLFISVGLFGYLKYGDDCEISITLNMNKDELAAKICEVYCVDRMKNNTNHSIRWQYLVRTACCLLSVLVALGVPYLNHFISMVGSFRAVLVFSLPALMNICLNHPDYGRGNWSLVKDLLLIILGISTSILGIGMNINNIVKELQKEA